MKQLNRNFLAQKADFFLSDIEMGPDTAVNALEERVLQFGEGNFLRAFVDSFIDMLNEQDLFNGSIVVIQPIEHGLTDVLNAQEGCYTVLLRGLENQKPVVRKRIVTSISRGINPYKDYEMYLETAKNPHLRFIISNTTEAGIAFLETDKLTDKPQVSFPAKVTALLYERYKYFSGDPSKGFIFIPCELIDDNGTELKKAILQNAKNWELPDAFIEWIHNANHFTNTLVDRIVTGYPKDEADNLTKELGYKDNLLVTAEIFQFFAIEASKETVNEISKTLPFHKVGLDVVLTEDVTPYKLRKVRILNGAHTISVLAAFLCGKDAVGEMMDEPLFVDYLKKGIFQEIMPGLDLDEEDLKSFANSVFDRFANPYIKHYLLSISLNSISKYKARVLPSILEYHKRKGELPEILTLSFAALIAFYRGTSIEEGALIGSRNGQPYKIVDDMEILTFFKELWGNVGENAKGNIEHLVQAVCAKTEYWGANLNELPGFSQKVTAFLTDILADTDGMKKTLEKVVSTC